MLNTLAAATYTLVKPATPWINWTDLWHIIVASLAAGGGIAIAYGLMLLGTQRGQEGKNESTKVGGWILGILAGAFCVGAIAVGVYVMTNPPASTPDQVVKNPPSTSSSTALVIHHTHHKQPA
jgi:hypothetical protein